MTQTMNYRMVQMQIMNLVNIGIKNNIPYDSIEKLGVATIDATQLFLQDYEVETLRIQLKNRLVKQKREVLI